MKKILLLIVTLSFSACKKEKDELSLVLGNFTPLDSPQNIIGKWRWIGSFGGWGSQTPDSTTQQILIVNTNKTYQFCKNQNCQTGEWVYGFRILDDREKQKRDSLLIFKPLQKGGSVMNARHIESLKDTLILGLFCDDCFNPVYVREK